jgi:Alkaline phosphatase PhoX
MRRRTFLVCAALAAILALGTAAALAGDNSSGFKTGQPSMLSAVKPGVQITPLLTVGDVLRSGYRFESIPDGISVRTRGQGRADLFVNHETGKVPFPYNAAAPTAANGENDFDNAQVSRLLLNQHSAGVLNGSFVIRSSAGYQRFCSNYLATAKEGFDRPIFFTNEESPDYVYRQEESWPPTPGDPAEEEAGLVVALDVKTGKHHPIYGMGRHNHENSVAVPGFDELVVLSGDDTFQTNPPASSQLYMYTAEDTDELWADEGTLHAFVADGTDNDYFDLQPGETISGSFVAVPDEIAKGKDADDGHELTQAVDFPAYPVPSGGPSVPPDGPQWILDQWGNVANTPSVAGNDVFDFIRLEDIAYDKRPGMSNVVYIADSGRATAGPANQLTTSTNGRIYKMVLDPDETGDPTEAEISILVQGDDVATVATDPVGSFNEIHQPDNLETTPNGNLLITEDPSGNNNYALPAGPGKTTARLWRVPLGAVDPDASKTAVLAVDQSLDENANPAMGAVDVDAAGPGRLGAWESSGIVDASAAFGPGAFFLTIQAATYWVTKQAGPDILNMPNGPDYFFKKAGGQLILLKLPGI